jgi:hypothetical protein
VLAGALPLPLCSTGPLLPLALLPLLLPVLVHRKCMPSICLILINGVASCTVYKKLTFTAVTASAGSRWCLTCWLFRNATKATAVEKAGFNQHVAHAGSRRALHGKGDQGAGSAGTRHIAKRCMAWVRWAHICLQGLPAPWAAQRPLLLWAVQQGQGAVQGGGPRGAHEPAADHNAWRAANGLSPKPLLHGPA